MKQETTEEKTAEQLIQQEATEYYNMAKDYRRDRYLKEESEVIILSEKLFFISFNFKIIFILYTLMFLLTNPSQ